MPMKFSRIALIAATVAMTACASDGATNPTDSLQIESRLAAVASAPDASASLASTGVIVRVVVTNSLTETVSGSRCAQVVEARLASDSRWTDVTSTSAACSAIAILVAPGATATFDGIADPSKIRGVASAGSSVLIRVRHSLVGGDKTYVMMSNEVVWVVR